MGCLATDGWTSVRPRVETPPRAQVARTPREREQLAKDWLLRMTERTPLPQGGDLPVSWIATETPPLIADILAALADPAAAPDRELEPAERERAAKLARLRDGPAAPEQIPRDLAALQALLVETIRREIPERRGGGLPPPVERLPGGIRGLPGPVQLDEWLRILLAEQRRYGHGFSVVLVDIDGLGLINDAYGRETGDHLLTALAGVIRRQVREVDQAFRLAGSEFCVLCPHEDAASLVPMAERIASLVEGSQADEGPRIAIAIGIAACPDDGEEAELLLEAAQEATYSAKAAGRHVGTGPNSPEPIVQDR